MARPEAPGVFDARPGTLNTDLIEEPTHGQERAGHPDDGPYVELYLTRSAEHTYGHEFAHLLKRNYEYTDVLFRLAEKSGVC